MIGLSPLPTAHPLVFQHQWVRSSIPCYRNFNLAMGRSLGFGSAQCNLSPSSDSVSLRLRLLWLNLAAKRNSLTHYAKGTQSHRSQSEHGAPTACRHTVSGSISLSLTEFFSPFPHGTCSLSVICSYLALDNGLPRFRQDITCPVVLGNQPGDRSSFCLRGCYPLWRPFPVAFG